MATLSSFSSSSPPPPSFPNANPNPEFLSPMLQKYLDQQEQQQGLGLPGNEEGEHEILHDPVASELNSGPIPASVPNSNEPVDRTLPSVFHVSFNQDYGCFTIGTDRGFRIFNCEPFKQLFRRESDNGGGIGTVEMLFRCNILALVGGGDNPQYPPTKVMIWDDHQGHCIGELTFRSEVRGVRLRRDRIVVVLEQKIFVYNFKDLKVMHQIETICNPKGLCDVSQVAGSFVLVCPGLQKGQVRVEHFASKRTRFILAHDSRLACFTLSSDGNLLATASTKGTLIRIFNTQDGSLLQEVLYLLGCLTNPLKH